MVNNSNNINKTNNDLSPQIIEHKQTLTYDVENPGLALEHAQQCGGVNISSDGQQFHQYQENEQSPLTSNLYPGM